MTALTEIDKSSTNIVDIERIIFVFSVLKLKKVDRKKCFLIMLYAS